MINYSLYLLYRVIKITIVIITTALLFFCCTSQHRLSKLLTKHPELLKVDSTEKKLVVITPEKKNDLVISDSSLLKSTKESPIVKDSNGVVTSVYHYNNQTFIESKCKQDTTIHNYYNINKSYKVIDTTKKNTWKDFLLCFLLGSIFILLVVAFKRK